MVRNELIEEILSMPSADRQYVRDVVLASLANDLPSQLSAAERKKVMRRLAAYDKNPSTYLTWKQMKKQLGEQREGPKH